MILIGFTQQLHLPEWKYQQLIEFNGFWDYMVFYDFNLEADIQMDVLINPIGERLRRFRQVQLRMKA